jgi:hypothetical protein
MTRSPSLFTVCLALLGLGLLLGACTAPGAFVQPGGEPFEGVPATPAQQEEEPLPILQQEAAVAATDLRAEAVCSDTRLGTAVATLSWSLPAGQEQVEALRVDVTAFREGFRTEQFETIAVLPPSQNSVEWDQGEPGINYYWRVLARTPRGWIASEIARYKVPICPVDFQREQDVPEG